jgi:hypothetical protein
MGGAIEPTNRTADECHCKSFAARKQGQPINFSLTFAIGADTLIVPASSASAPSEAWQRPKIPDFGLL